MSLVKYQPRHGRLAFLDTFFDDFFTRDRFFSDLRNEATHQPSANICETKEAYRIELSTPGFRKDDFVIELNDRVLKISGRVEQSKEAEAKTYSRREFKSASFSRSFTLPETVHEEKIEATYENGLLHITLPKKEEAQPQSRAIPLR